MIFKEINLFDQKTSPDMIYLLYKNFPTKLFLLPINYKTAFSSKIPVI